MKKKPTTINDIVGLSGEELLDLLEEIIVRNKYAEGDWGDKPDNDNQLYHDVRGELEDRLNDLDTLEGK